MSPQEYAQLVKDCDAGLKDPRRMSDEELVIVNQGGINSADPDDDFCDDFDFSQPRANQEFRCACGAETVRRMHIGWDLEARRKLIERACVRGEL